MKIVYFVHDVYDAAVGKRVRMLIEGGAEPTLIGFRRRAEPLETLHGRPVIDLGRTRDAALKARALSVLTGAATAGRLAPFLKGADVVMARSLELLVVARAAMTLSGLKAPLVYECLDIHRLMASPGLAGKALRGMERSLVSGCALLIVSSPAFDSRYFKAMQGVKTPVMLLENKLFDPAGQAAPPAQPLAAGPPWRIGWFGVIRCRRSFTLLSEVARRLDGRLEVVIAGRPFEVVFPDLAGEAAAAPHVTYLGPYVPADLPRLYGDVHFTWAIDWYEAGVNSDWLLPNRIYEGGAFGSPPIGLAGVETGRWIAARGLGVLLGDEPTTELEAWLEGLDADRYAGLVRTARAAPRGDFIADAAEAKALVNRLAGL